MKARTLEGPYTVIAGGSILEIKNVELEPPDYSVGIMEWQITGFEAYDLLGDEIDIEDDEVVAQLMEQIND